MRVRTAGTPSNVMLLPARCPPLMLSAAPSRLVGLNALKFEPTTPAFISGRTIGLRPARVRSTTWRPSIMRPICPVSPCSVAVLACTVTESVICPISSFASTVARIAASILSRLMLKLRKPESSIATS